MSRFYVPINPYFAILVITIVGALATQLIVREANALAYTDYGDLDSALSSER